MMRWLQSFVEWRGRFSVFVLACASVAGASGCGTYYRAETTLHLDGTVERAIYQPMSDTPAESLDPSIWDKVADVEEADNTTASIADLIRRAQELDPEEVGSYVAAVGRFDAMENIPGHLVFPSPDEKRFAKLDRRGGARDLVFVVEHIWNETLTDVVSLNDLKLARRDLADTAIAIFLASVDEAFGPDVDTSKLRAWLEEDGRRWFYDSTDALYDTASRRRQLHADPELEEFGFTFFRAIGRIAATHGLKVTRTNGQLLPRDAVKLQIIDFVRKKVEETVRRKNGKPVDQEVLERFIELVDDPPWNGLDDRHPIHKAIRAECERRFGDLEKAEDHFAALSFRIHGAHVSNRRFRYSLTVPGIVVQTNGLLVAPNEVRWEFHGFDAYPRGYLMHCRALAPNLAEQERVFGRKPLESRRDLLAYRRLIDSDANLLSAMKQCREAGSSRPLLKYRQGIVELAQKRVSQMLERDVNNPAELAKYDEELDRVLRLFKLLL